MKASQLEVVSWISLSIVSSTSLILLLKQVGKRLTCNFTTTLSTFHFLSTWGGLQIIASVGKIRKVDNIPMLNRVILASLVVLSIVSMNFNLRENSIGFYQMSKLICIPYMIVYDYLVKGTKYTSKELLSLFVVLTGVAMFSISDIEVNFLGTVYAVIAILSTAHNQMLTSDYQKQYNINGPELQLAIVPQEFLIGVVASLIIECHGQKNFLTYNFNGMDILLMLGTCLFSVGVNTATFGLIGKTSTITYQVVGHFKTVLLLVLGYIFFPTKWPSTLAAVKAYSGIVVALLGVFWYTKVKLDKAKPSQKSEDSVNLLEKNEDVELAEE